MQPHRSSALGYASAASAAHSRVYGACAAEAAASESSGLSVGGCHSRSSILWAAPRTYHFSGTQMWLPRGARAPVQSHDTTRDSRTRARRLRGACMCRKHETIGWNYWTLSAVACCERRV